MLKISESFGVESLFFMNPSIAGKSFGTELSYSNSLRDPNELISVIIHAFLSPSCSAHFALKRVTSPF